MSGLGADVVDKYADLDGFNPIGRGLCGFQSFNPTSMCAYSNDFDQTF